MTQTDRTATAPLHRHLAVVFDFDETLAPDSYGELVESCGLDADRFKRERVRPLVDAGWEEILAKFYCLIEESERRDADEKITRDRIAAFGRELDPYPGVPKMFDRLRRCVRELSPEVAIEFYIVSSGIADIARNSHIARNFRLISGCEFHYGENGEIRFVKRVISHTEKTKYLHQISKGLVGGGDVDAPFRVYADVPLRDLRVPMSQMIYVGDGSSDLPAFSLIHDEGGVALGIYKGDSAQGWEHTSRVSKGDRVANLVPPDYREDSELMRSLFLAVEKVVKQIQLRELSVGE